MTANIVERLRNAGDRDEGRPYSTMHEAADMIERLQATVNGMIEKGMDELTLVAAFQVNEELRDEIKRLRMIEDAAIDAATYFHIGNGGENEFDEQRMVNLMAKLGRTLERKP